MNDSTNNLTEQMMQTFADMAKAATPTVNFNKNGYEIRSNVLEMAQNQAWQDYEATVRMGGAKITKVAGDNTTTTTFEMPDVPGATEILKTAQAFYDFVNNNTKSKD